MIYTPREDSFLINRFIPKYVKKNSLVLDLCTGTGILAISAARKARQVYALDINKEAIKYAKEQAREQGINNIIFLVSDLFSALKRRREKIKFDLILINPPYLPGNKEKEGYDIVAGKKGYEIIERIFEDVSEFLKERGKILLVFSSLTSKARVDEIIKKQLFNYELIAKEKYFFEELYLYLIEKSRLLKKIESTGLTNIKYFTKGKRSNVYLAKFKGKQVIIKVASEKTKAKGFITREAKWLRLLNKYKIGPRLYLAKKDFIVIEFIDGITIKEFLSKEKDKNKLRKVINKIFDQLFLLDKLCINKKEMNHPDKHILIKNSLRPVLIDFERASKARKVKNVTQFCQYLKKFIKVDEEKLRELLKDYKRRVSEEKIKDIKNLFIF